MGSQRLVGTLHIHRIAFLENSKTCFTNCLSMRKAFIIAALLTAVHSLIAFCIQVLLFLVF